MKEGDRVMTERHGAGVIVKIEHHSRIHGGTNYYGVELDDKSQFFYSPVYFWPKELTPASSPQPSPLAQKPNEQSIASAYESIERSEFASRDDANA